MSGGSLDPVRLTRLREVMAGHVESGAVPGVVALVCRRGEVHVVAVGSRTLGGADPIRRDTIFRIASITKPIVAAAAMVLVEECRLRLDEPVDRYLPELADRRVLRRVDGPLDDTVPARRPITLRDLLTFRHGFGSVMAAPDSYPIQRAATELRLGQGPPDPTVAPGPEEWIRRMGTLPLMYQPGERWAYSTGADVLGVLVARVAGCPLSAVLAERVLKPLGMVDTGFSVPPADLPRLATSYRTDPESGALEVYDPAENSRWSRPPAFPSAAGGLVSTADDVLAFGRMMLDRGRYGGGRLLSRPSVEAMTTDSLTDRQKATAAFPPGWFDGRGWGFGLSVFTRRDGGARSAGTFGWDGGLGTSWYTDPSEDLVGVLMTQRGWTSPRPPEVCLDFWTGVYAAIDD